MNKFAKFGLAAIAVTAAATSALAITDTDFKYSTPKAAYLTINAMSFAPDGFSAPEYSISWSSGSLTANSSAAETQCFNTHVNLPASARLTGLRVWTTSTNGGVNVQFMSQRLSTGLASSIIDTRVGDSSGARKATLVPIDASVPVINNTQAYGLGVCLAPGQSFSGARIEYNALNAGF